MAGTDQRRGSNDDGRRLTKAERREEARLKREEIQRKMATRKRNRRIGLVLVVVAVVIAVVAVFMTSGGDDASPSGIPSAATLLSQASAAADTAGCDAVQETPNYADAPGDDPRDRPHAHRDAARHLGSRPVHVRDDPARVGAARSLAARRRRLRLPAGRVPDDPLAGARSGDHLVLAGRDRASSSTT